MILNHSSIRSVRNSAISEQKRNSKELEAWCEEWKECVFLRDLLSASLSLSFNKIDPRTTEYTPIGKLEHKAKEECNETAIIELANHAINTMNEIDIYKRTDFICAIPSCKEFNLPHEIVMKIRGKTGKTDITSGFCLQSTKPDAKSSDIKDRWDDWENTNLFYKKDHSVNIKGKDVILIDDKYQSGVALHFVAMKLQEAGVRNVYGLCMVKTLSNKGNQN